MHFQTARAERTEKQMGIQLSGQWNLRVEELSLCLRGIGVESPSLPRTFSPDNTSGVNLPTSPPNSPHPGCLSLSIVASTETNSITFL